MYISVTAMCKTSCISYFLFELHFIAADTKVTLMSEAVAISVLSYNICHSRCHVVVLMELLKANAQFTVVDSSTIIVLTYVTTESKRSFLIRMVRSFQKTDRGTYSQFLNFRER